MIADDNAAATDIGVALLAGHDRPTRPGSGITILALDRCSLGLHADATSTAARFDLMYKTARRHHDDGASKSRATAVWRRKQRN